MQILMADAERTVSYNERAFLINGEPELLLSACIHYFRVPRALWADRIAKAKRGGMNTIETYVAWNVHEPEPGVWNFAGDNDLSAFFDECERQGMYIIARPGPYICAEWDFGGFPAWLGQMPGIAFRTMNEPYLRAVDAYFDAVVPILKKHQWSEGGGILLVQVENEYANLRWTRGTDMVVDDDYQHYIRDGLLNRGIDVPLISCAGYCSGTVECVNATNPADQMPGFRTKFPDKPLFSTEFWTGWYDIWDDIHHTRPAADVEYASLRCFAEGASGYNYYVYHGGTNFGYTPMYRQTTSYDYDAHISETGRLTEKWRACRRVALFAQTFKEILLNGTHRANLPATNGLRATEMATKERGAILFVDNPDSEKTVQGAVIPFLPEITLEAREIFPWVHDAPIGASDKYLAAYAGLVKSDAQVLTAHLLPDPHEGARVYVYGNPSEKAEVVLFGDGQRGQSVTVEFDNSPRVYPVGDGKIGHIVALPTELAAHVWFPDDLSIPVVIGADDVREQNETGFIGEFAPGQSHMVYLLHPDSTLETRTVDAPALPEPPILSPFRSVNDTDYSAIDFDDSNWRSISEPTSMLVLGNGSNPYGWYRAVIESDEATDATIHFSACSDRLTLWINGERIGASGIPPEDRRQEWTATFDIRLREGRNVVCVLADNLGLIKGDWQIGKGQEQEKKGIYGAITITPSGNCYQIEVNQWRFAGKLHGELIGLWQPSDDWDRYLPQNGEIRWHRATFRIDTPPDTATPLLIRMDGMGKGVLWLNGHNLGRYWQVGPQRDYYAPEPWLNADHENVLVIAETEGNLPTNVSLVWDERAAAVVEVTF